MQARHGIRCHVAPHRKEVFYLPKIADLFTKPLSGPSHRSLLSKLGVTSCLSNLSGGNGFDFVSHDGTHGETHGGKGTGKFSTSNVM
uniref:Uncharacterized protein n=1 Tax=Solanum tuberosum TaxID=4113 RepID=M1DBE1_SOLTU